MPAKSDDFSARLAAALKRPTAIPAAPPAAGAPAAGSPPSAPTTPRDDYSTRLSDALSRARGEPATADDQPAPAGGGPLGQGDYLVRQGDCMASIAVTTGFFWETLWKDPGNSELNQARKDPYILLPGDRVTIPEKRRKDESIAAEQRHRFKRKGCPEKLIVHFRVAGEPRQNKDYLLDIDGQITEGITDPNGRVEIFIPPDARRGVVFFPDTQDAYDLNLGHLDPITEVAGVQGRLKNLGFYSGALDGRASPALERAITAFQTHNDLPATGTLDDAGRKKLQDLHGS